MTYEVDFSERAADDLSEIIRYISEALYNPQAAGRFYNEVSEKRGLLCDHPHMFPLYHDSEEIRFIVIGNFLMFYVVDDEKSIVSIVRILYGRRDIASGFGESQI